MSHATAEVSSPPDGALLDAIAREVGTPVYVYDARAIDRAYRALDAALAGCPHAIHYALKANSTLAVVQLLRHLGAGADAAPNAVAMTQRSMARRPEVGGSDKVTRRYPRTGASTRTLRDLCRPGGPVLLATVVTSSTWRAGTLTYGAWSAPSIVTRSARGKAPATMPTARAKMGALSVPLVSNARWSNRHGVQVHPERIGTASLVDEPGAIVGECVAQVGGRDAGPLQRHGRRPGDRRRDRRN